MLFVAFRCSFWFLVRVSICRSLPFVALRCSSLLFFVFEIESILIGLLLLVMVFCCSFWFFEDVSI